MRAFAISGRDRVQVDGVIIHERGEQDRSAVCQRGLPKSPRRQIG